jgi:U4/U6.U5 tri-snRNP-associated protein 3
MDDGKNDDLDKRRDNGTDDDEDDDIVVEDDMMAQMQAMMGFGGFDTTKQKKIPGNNLGAVRKEKKTEYRQYMNRVGGFNRPLSPPRD